MNREIKEILDMFTKYKDNWYSAEYKLKPKQCVILFDYITNLQEENEYNNYCNEELRKKITNLEYKKERLKEDNKQLKELCDKYEEEHSTTFNYWKQLIKEDYKSRCEKAIEYINTRVDSFKANKYELLNILKGSE